MVYENPSFIAAVIPIICGSVSGGCGIVVGHPFDTLKVQMQVRSNISARNPNILKHVKNLYRGIVPPLVTAGIISSINFSLYENFKYKLASINDYNNGCSGQETTAEYLQRTFIAGSLGGGIVSFLTSPISLVKVRRQLTENNYLLSSISQVYKSKGVLGFYRGFSCFFIMESLGRGVYLYTYEAVKIILINVKGSNSLQHQSSIYDRILAAGIAGCVSWFVIYPCDVLKSRLQLDFEGVRFKNVTDCLIDTWREGGIRSLYRGISFTLIRAAPVAATVLPIYDTMKEFLDKELLISSRKPLL